MEKTNKTPFKNIDKIKEDTFYCPCQLANYAISPRTAANWRKIERKINGIKPVEEYKDKYQMVIDEKKKMKVFIGPKWKRKGLKNIVYQGKDIIDFTLTKEKEKEENGE